MSKKNIYVCVVIVLSCVILLLGVLLFKVYYEKGYFKGNPKKVVELNIPDTTVTRVAVLGSNSKHFEISTSEDIQETIDMLRKIKLSYTKVTDEYKNSIPGFECKITVYTIWDEEITELEIVNENVIKYNDSYYNIEDGTFDLQAFEAIVNK